MRYRSWALTRHRGGDECSDLFRRFDKVRIGKVGAACRVAMPVVPEKPADVTPALREAAALTGVRAVFG